jgi:hypothetical protein
VEAANRLASIPHLDRASGLAAGAFTVTADADRSGAGFPSEVSTPSVLAIEEHISATSLRSAARSYDEVVKSPNMWMPFLSKVVDVVEPPSQLPKGRRR